MYDIFVIFFVLISYYILKKNCFLSSYGAFLFQFQHASNEKEDLEKEVDELKQLLSEANSRSDEKELLVFELEEKVEKLTAEIEEKKRGMYRWKHK